MRPPGYGMRERILIHVLRRGGHPAHADRLEEQLATEEQTALRVYCRETLSGPECCPLHGRLCGCPGEHHR
ncbi:MAG: hypothetical protein Q7T55_19855 [Solirubrobacteraceae bacterium]|nr:hypothetical protein [Solirubrobacteraceae bacterium]